MKINGEKVKSYDPVSGQFICESGSLWYLSIGVDVELEENEGEKLDAIELVKNGMSADDLVKLRREGLI